MGRQPFSAGRRPHLGFLAFVRTRMMSSRAAPGSSARGRAPTFATRRPSRSRSPACRSTSSVPGWSSISRPAAAPASPSKPPGARSKSTCAAFRPVHPGSSSAAASSSTAASPHGASPRRSSERLRLLRRGLTARSGSPGWPPRLGQRGLSTPLGRARLGRDSKSHRGSPATSFSPRSPATATAASGSCGPIKSTATAISMLAAFRAANGPRSSGSASTRGQTSITTSPSILTAVSGWLGKGFGAVSPISSRASTTANAGLLLRGL